MNEKSKNVRSFDLRSELDRDVIKRLARLYEAMVPQSDLSSRAKSFKSVTTPTSMPPISITGCASQRKIRATCTVLSLARMAAQGAAETGAAVAEFEVLMVPVDGKAMAARAQLFRLVVSGGDRGEPVLTLMLPGED